MYSPFAFTLSPLDHASFATSSRLLSCLVTESLLKAIFVPTRSLQEDFVGTAIVLTPPASKHEAPYILRDVFVIVPLRQIPVFKPGSNVEIGLLDPLDMLPYVYESFRDVKAFPSHNTQVCHRYRIGWTISIMRSICLCTPVFQCIIADAAYSTARRNFCMGE